MSTSQKGKGIRSPYLWIITGLFVAAIIIWQFYKYRIVNRSVNKAITEKSKELYRIHYEDLSIDEAGGALHVRNISISPDTAVYNQLVKEHKNPPTLIKLFIPALEVLGVKTPKALLTKQIEGHKVAIAGPVIEIELDRFSKDTTVYNPDKDLYRELLGKFLMIRVDSIAVTHAKVLVRSKGEKEPVFSGDDVSFVLSDLLIDSIAVKDSSRILFSRNLDINLNELIFPSKNKRYRLHIEKVRYTSENNSVNIGSIRLIPQLQEAAFAASWPRQKDRYSFSFEDISLLHISRRGLWRKRIEADSLVVNKSEWRVYRDLSYPPDTTSKVGKFPQELLMRLTVPVNIRKLIFNHSFIEYKEKNAKSDSAGKVRFFDVRAVISNVTNMKEAISRDNRCTLSFKAKFLNKAPVGARLVMLLNDPRGRFLIDGNIGAIEAVSLNDLIVPMGLARMEKGTIQQLHFNFSGTDSSSTGKLTILYNDLAISLLKKNRKKDQYDKKGLPSLAVNLLMKKSNPKKGENVLVAEVHFKRILNKSFFNLIWKTIFAGIKETVGVK